MSSRRKMAKVRVIGCDTPKERLEEGGASFETPAARAPQDEEFFSMPSTNRTLMLRRAEDNSRGASRSTHGGIAADPQHTQAASGKGRLTGRNAVIARNTSSRRPRST